MLSDRDVTEHSYSGVALMCFFGLLSADPVIYPGNLEFVEKLRRYDFMIGAEEISAPY